MKKKNKKHEAPLVTRADIEAMHGKRVMLQWEQENGEISTIVGFLGCYGVNCYVTNEFNVHTSFCGKFQMILPNLKRIVSLKLFPVEYLQVKLESVDPLGCVMKSVNMNMRLNDDFECGCHLKHGELRHETFLLHVGECLYIVNKKGVIIDKIIPHEHEK